MNNRLMHSPNNTKSPALPCGAFCLALAVIGAVFAVNGYAPFGTQSFAVGDAYTQYFDFFLYGRRLLTGSADANYSFSFGLGGSPFAVISYYLLSPLNLLFLLFKEEDVILFYHLLTALKLALAAAACAVFLQRRVEKLPALPLLLLSAGYGISAYTTQQARNIMWLDAVYLLPLLLLGVYRLVQGRRGLMLSICTALVMLINWYAGAVCCLFSALWLVLELLLIAPETEKTLRFVLTSLGRYAAAMVLGIGMSMTVFWPTLLALRRGRGSADWDSFSLALRANPLHVLQQMFVMGQGDSGDECRVSLFCGALALLGIFLLFTAGDKIITLWQKGVYALCGGVLILLFCWQPAVLLFSLLKEVNSYWYRYSFVGVLFIVYLAACGFAAAAEETVTLRRGLCAFLCLPAVVLLFVSGGGALTNRGLLCTAVFLAADFALYLLPLCLARAGSGAPRRAAALLLTAAVCAELGCGASFVWKMHGNFDIAAEEEYVRAQQEQVDALQSLDGGFYRVQQTMGRCYPSYVGKNITSNYNEGLAYGYFSIASFTSSVDTLQQTFLDKLGYNGNNLNMNITNTPMLAQDALLSVEYILSTTEIPYLQTADVETANGKTVYENPYCLPAAFVYTSGIVESNELEQDPFVYTNSLFSSLLGREVVLYKSVETSGFAQDGEDAVTARTGDLADGKYLVYAMADSAPACDFYCDGSYLSAYKQWLAPRTELLGDGSYHTVTLKAEGITPETAGELRVYALDLNLLGEVCGELSARAADSIDLQNGKAEFTATAQGENEYLYVSVPDDGGWTVQCNGVTVTPARVSGCMMAVPLQAGENHVTLRYRTAGLRAGPLCSAASLLALCVWAVLEKRLLKKREE